MILFRISISINDMKCTKKEEYQNEEWIVKQFETLKSSRDFTTVYKKGKSLANRYLVMYIKKNDREKNRFGISVSKKVGNSVIRHRVTRLIRESVRLHDEKIEQGYDIILIARPTSKGKGFADVESAFLHLVKLHHLFVKGNQNENNKKNVDILY